jgi:hypothetical protein
MTKKSCILFLLLLNFNLNADDSELKILKPKLRKKSQSVTNLNLGKTRISKNASELEMTIDKLNDQGRKIETLLGNYQQRSGVWDFTNQYDFKSGTVIKGILLNSVVSTNLESPLIVEVLENEMLPVGTKFICRGVTKFNRVHSACNKLIIPDGQEEFEVQVSLLNEDGSSGLKADEVFTGKEQYIAATVATAFSKGLIELSTDRLASPLGEITSNTRKNRLTNGVLSSLDETNNIMNSEMKSKEPKAYIGAGKAVLIYFQERFKK